MAANPSEDAAVAAAYWDEQLRKRQTRTVVRVRWWEDDTTIRHINAPVGDAAAPGPHGAFHARIQRHFAGRSNLKAVSVGCGAGAKEMALMRLVDVGRFDLYDISPANIELGRSESARQGLSDRTRFFVSDAFASSSDADYDLVYWNNALHHMPDVELALRWSRDRLKVGALFAMDDFVGPDRFQWTDENLAWAKRVRQNLSAKLLENPYSPGAQVPLECVRPTVEAMLSADPSEAMDSGRILQEVRATFPSAEIIPTGGALYHLALNDLFCNFVTEEDLACLRQILLLDEALARAGTTQYAVALATREPESGSGGKSGRPLGWMRLGGRRRRG